MSRRSEHGQAGSTALLAILVCSLLCLNTWLQGERVLDRIEQLENRLREADVTSTWISGGITRSLVTRRYDGESLEAWGKRHDQEVSEMLRIFPKDI